MKGRRFAAALAAVAAMVASGCYTYTPMSPADIQPDTRVRVTVSQEQSEELAPVLRDPGARFNATFLEADDGSLLLSVPLRGGRAGMSSRALQSRVRVPRGHLVALEGREMSYWRTGLVVGAIATALGFAAAETFGGDDDATKEKGGEVNESIGFRIPIAIFGH